MDHPAIFRGFAAGLGTAMLCCLAVIWHPVGATRAPMPTVLALRIPPAFHITRAESLAARITARPLFDAHRRQTVTQAARAPSPAALPRLAGTLMTQSARLAIFAGSPHSAVLREGDTVAGMTLEHVAAGHIILRDRGRRFTLLVTPSAQGGSPALILPAIAERMPDGMHEE